MKYKVTLNDRVYEIEVEAGKAILLDEYEAIAPAAPAPAAPAATPVAAPEAAPAAAPAAVTAAGETVSAPMPGTILKVNVTQGQTIKEGDLLCILEAMKMENEIMSPKAGTIVQVVTSKGSNVETGTPLIVIG